MAANRNGRDFIDIWQQHNRNVALRDAADAARKRQRAAEEQAHQARLDREANDRHRAEMKAIAEKRAEMEAQRLKIAQEEKNAREFAKLQNNRLYEISYRLKDWDAAPASPLEKIRQLYKLKSDLETVVFDAIIDLKYKKLYSDTQNRWQKYSENFKLKHADEFSCYQKHLELEQQVEPYIEGKISSVKGVSEARQLVEELKNFSAEHPELAPDEDEIELVQESVNEFTRTAAQMKGLWQTLNEKQKITSNDTFVSLLCNNFEIGEDVFASELWCQLSEVECSQVTIHQFCNFCFRAMMADPSVSDTVFQIFDSVENPQAISGIQQTRKKLYSELVNLLNARNQSAKKEIHQETCACSCLFLIIPLIAALFFWPAIIIVLAIGIIGYVYHSSKLKKMPIPKLKETLKNKYEMKKKQATNNSGRQA